MQVQLDLESPFAREIHKLLSEIGDGDLINSTFKSRISLSQASNNFLILSFIVNETFIDLVKKVEFFVYREKNDIFTINIHEQDQQIEILGHASFKIYIRPQ